MSTGSGCLSRTAQPKSRDGDWIVIAPLLISDAGNLRRWQVRTPTSPFPQAHQEQVAPGEAWEGSVEKNTEGVLMMFRLWNLSPRRGFGLDERLYFWFLEQNGQDSDKDLKAS